MRKNTEEFNCLYIKELTGARVRADAKKHHPTFFSSKISVDEEIEHAVKYRTWGMRNA